MKLLPLIKQDLLIFWVIATTSLCAGLLFNQFRDTPVSWVYESKEQQLSQAVAKISTQQDSHETASPSLNAFIPLNELQKFIEQKRGIVLDARPEIFHRLGHIPGALSLPREDFENSYNKLKKNLEINKNQPLVIYCSSASCGDSKLVKNALTRLGYTQVLLFEGGWSEWTQAHLKEEKNQ